MTNFAFLSRTVSGDFYNFTTKCSSCELSIDFKTFPNHMSMIVWVEAQNKLGTVQSDKLINDSEVFGM